MMIDLLVEWHYCSRVCSEPLVPVDEGICQYAMLRSHLLIATHYQQLWIAQISIHHIIYDTIDRGSEDSVRGLITCGRQSGRDSNITSSTPIGTLSWTSSRSFITRIFLITFPITSSSSILLASCFKPAGHICVLLQNDNNDR